jgi:hypothetical protein
VERQLEPQVGSAQPKVPAVELPVERSDVDAVEAVDGGDEGGHLGGRRDQPSFASGRGPHDVGGGPHRRLLPVADDEAVAGREAGAGDDA